MGRLLTIIAASLVLLCVVAIFIAPSLDLPDTAVRGRQTWAAILLAAGALLLFALLPAVSFLLKPDVALSLLIFDPDRSRSQLTC